MNLARCHILILLLLILSSGVCYAQNNGTQHIEKRYNIFFRINSPKIEEDFQNNDRTLEILRQDLQSTIQQDGAVPDSLVIISSASPDGSHEFNKHLAQSRAENTRKKILETFPELKNTSIKIKHLEEDWDGLYQILKTHPDFPQREEMMAVILDNKDIQSKEQNLRALQEGWEYLINNHIYALRNSAITLTVVMTATNSDDEFVREKPSRDTLSYISFSNPSSLETTDKPLAFRTVEASSWQRHLYLKTNTLGLGLAISNLGCEIDIAKHLSISVPVYYSALNYFTETIKFRTLAIQPELRYWTNRNNDGLFFGIHGGVAQYNIAVDGDLRYQDHDGTSPALGGGIGIGYRLPISDDNRWHIEFALGAGIYKLHYDTFYNVHNGKLIDTYHDVYYGLDNAAINISYRFDLKKRKK